MLFYISIKRLRLGESDKRDAKAIKQIENEFNKLFLFWRFIVLRAKKFPSIFAFFAFYWDLISVLRFYNARWELLVTASVEELCENAY